jgi:hypothetical protein
MPEKNTTPNKRRKLLKFLGLAGLFGSAKSQAQIRIQKVLEPVNTRAIASFDSPKYITVKLLRPEDLLSLELRYYNCSLSGNKIQRKADPAYLVVVFQTQSMMEQAWVEDANGLSNPAIPGRLIAGGDSRLVFQLPVSLPPIPLVAADLLAWEKYELVVNERAKGVSSGRRVLDAGLQNKNLTDFQKKVNPQALKNPVGLKRGLSKDEKLILGEMQVYDAGLMKNITRAVSNASALVKDEVSPPGELETSLEIPVRLHLSPTKTAGWKHQTQLKDVKGIIKETNKLFELWHTRMCAKKGNVLVENGITNEERILRALWADDGVKNHTDPIVEIKPDPQVGLTSITNKNRNNIVHESSNFSVLGFSPKPIKAYKLFLTTLGAWLDSEFVIELDNLKNGKMLDNGFGLLKWRHIETMGREHYVEIADAGYIMPFGHEAVLLTITERKPHPGSGTAANFQRQLVVITEPVKEYNYKDRNGEFMEFTFSSVEMITTVSPFLDADKTSFINMDGSLAKDDQFIIRSGKKDVQFKIKGKDLNDSAVDFTMPLVFVRAAIIKKGNYLNQLIERYNNAGMNNINDTDFKGQKFTLAPQELNGATTSYTTSKAVFRVKPYSKFGEWQGFLPTIGNVEIIEPSYQRITGIVKKVPVALVDVQDEVNNKGGVFAKFLQSAPVNFAGNADKVGGLATPNFNLTGLSKAAGAFGGDLNDFMSGVPNPANFFNVNNLPDPTLFGVFKLSELLKFTTGDTFNLSKTVSDRINNSGIPNLVTEDTADAFITTYAIKPDIGSKTIGSSFARFQPANQANSFQITSTIKAWKNSSKAPEFKSSSELKNFEIGIVGVGSDYLIKVKFDHIKFDVSDKKKPDVSVKLKEGDGISFGGPLSFINALNSLIPMDGFDDPPYLDVSLTGVKCGYTQALPNLQLGAFTLANISIGAEVNLPFTGGPLTMAFRFCERHQPFTLTYACLGGGGFFGLEVDLQGIRQIEAAFELGAAASVNFGVASGAVSIMAGIYFKMTFESGQNSTQLTGYIRINGAVSVLGLITASIELYMALTYLIDKNKAYGEASLKIKVEVLFFSKTVTIQTQRTFAGSGNDPNFGAAILPADWATYCEAFAA